MPTCKLREPLHLEMVARLELLCTSTNQVRKFCEYASFRCVETPCRRHIFGVSLVASASVSWHIQNLGYDPRLLSYSFPAFFRHVHVFLTVAHYFILLGPSRQILVTLSWRSIRSISIEMPPIATLLLLSFLPLISAQGSFTLTSLAAYTSLRACADPCFYANGYGLVNILSCGAPYQDACVCRTDLTASGSTFLSSCVTSSCSNTNDVTSAVSLYGSYCNNVNGLAAQATTTVGNAPAGSSKTITITATVISANGAVTTSPLSTPSESVVNADNPNYNNVIEINGSGNKSGAAARIVGVSLM
jgi:hypothetical protein